MRELTQYTNELAGNFQAPLQQRFTVTASIHTQQTFQLHFIRRELVVGKTWVTKLQNAPCNDAKSTTLKMQVAREIKFHIVHTYVVVRSLPF